MSRAEGLWGTSHTFLDASLSNHHITDNINAVKWISEMHQTEKPIDLGRMDSLSFPWARSMTQPGKERRSESAAAQKGVERGKNSDVGGAGVREARPGVPNSVRVGRHRLQVTLYPTMTSAERRPQRVRRLKKIEPSQWNEIRTLCGSLVHRKEAEWVEKGRERFSFIDILNAGVVVAVLER